MKIKTKLCDKRDDFTCPIDNFPFISSNIPASAAYGIYISQLVRYSIDCAQYSDFLDRSQLLMQKLLKQVYDRHHNLVDRNEISISQMAMDLLLFT